MRGRRGNLGTRHSKILLPKLRSDWFTAHT